MHVSVRIAEDDYTRLHNHLFPGDHDEHGAVLGVGVVQTERGMRLLVRRVFLAQDGRDYVPGDTGYRKLTAAFIATCVVQCEQEGLGYIAVHCHGGANTVSFSSTDMASHVRGYPALLGNLGGMPVGALVFAENAVAGDIWMSDGKRVVVSGMDVVGNSLLHLEDGYHETDDAVQTRFDRQVRMFGAAGQRRLATQKVGVIGVGGVGAIVAEQLHRLGVGQIVVVDDDRAEDTNLNRLVGSVPADVYPPKIYRLIPLLGKLRPFRPSRKVAIAKRHAKRSGSSSRMLAVPLSVTDPRAASQLVDCDYLFLAADTAQARLVYNAIVHQYLVPGVQMGVKIHVDQPTGAVMDISTWVRRTIPGKGCLWCSGLISPGRLQEESLTAGQKRQQRYVESDDADSVHAPSVIMLNGLVASHAVDGYIERLTGLSQVQELRWLWYRPPTEEWCAVVPPHPQARCPECSKDGKRFAMGDAITLPISGNR